MQFFRPTTVSYTHLDVYKRQPPVQAREKSRIPASCGNTETPVTEPVSYTHLDVYKRQGLRRMRTGKVQLAPGYDGEYGKIQLLDSAEMERLSGQLTLFGSEPQREELPSRPDTTFVRKQPQKEKALSAIPKDLIESLSSQQREAALSPHRTSAVIAGPGTGKTRTLVARILYLTGRMGVSPSEITAVTFTKKAAAEMLSRLQNQPGGKASFRSLQIGTFHSICLQALRSAGNHFGISGEPDLSLIHI